MPFLYALALLVGGPVAAGEMESPVITLSDVNWDAAAAALSDHGSEPPAAAFARLNAVTEKRFAGIGKSTVPVLLPFDVDALRKDVADGKSDAAVRINISAGSIRPNSSCRDRPATTRPSLRPTGSNTHFSKPIVVEISGAAFVYELDGPDHIEKEEPPPKELSEAFPGIRRVLSEAHVRYVFQRFGVPYVVSIQCYDMRPSSRHLACKEADPIAIRFSAPVAHRRRHAGEIGGTDDRPQPAGGQIGFHLLQPGRSDREHRLA